MTDDDFVPRTLGTLLASSNANVESINNVRSSLAGMVTKVERIDANVTDLRVETATLKTKIDSHSSRIAAHQQRLDELSTQWSAASPRGAYPNLMMEKPNDTEDIENPTVFKVTTSKRLLDTLKHPAVAATGAVGALESFRTLVWPLIKTLIK